MKKKNSGCNVSMPPAVLYLDDIEAIISLLANRQFSLSNSEYTFENIKDLQDLDVSYITDLTISIDWDKTTRAYIFFSQTHTTFNCYSDALDVAGLGEKIKSIITKKQRSWFPRAFMGNAHTFGIPNFVLLFATSWILISTKQSCLNMIGLFLLILSICIFYFNNYRYSIIIPKYRKQVPSFFERNKDQLLTAGVCSVGGTIIGALLNHFLSKYL